MTLARNTFQILRNYGTEEIAASGATLFRQGEAMLDLFIVLEGRLEMFETKHDGSTHVVQSIEAGAFAGELDLLNSRPSLLSCRVVRRSTILRIEREHFRDLLRAHGDVAEEIVLECLGRRANLLEHGHGGAVVLGTAQSSDTLRVREFFVRTRSPHRFVDIAINEDAHSLVQLLECSQDDLPAVFLPNHPLLRCPTNSTLAAALGIGGESRPSRQCDLAVIGAGPAGLAAAVYAASEGLTTVVVESHAAGGQAGTSSKIENYLGFVTGISGQDLAANAEIQAQRFGAELLLMHAASGLALADEGAQIELSDGSVVHAKAILIATGARYRRLELQNSSKCPASITIHYAATALEAMHCKDQEVMVVGGGNSAGQAAMFLTKHARHVHLVVRRDTLVETMSDYLVQRIESEHRISLYLGAAVADFGQERGIPRVIITRADGSKRTQCETSHIFAMVGADPNTGWLKNLVRLDEAGFIITGDRTTGASSNFETSCPGVFAVGDVRSGSVKRVASAAGEGAAVIADVHRFLASQGVPL